MIKQNQLLVGLILMTLFLAGCVETKDDSNRYNIDWNVADQNKDLNQPVDVNQVIEPSQFFCEKNEDCVKTDAFNCCGCSGGSPEVAVSKKWLASFTLPVCSKDTACTRSYHCTERIAQCVENKCILVENFMQKIQTADENVESFNLDEIILLKNSNSYHNVENGLWITNVSVYEFYCPPGVPCAYKPDNASFTFQIVENNQVILSKEIVLTQDGLTGQSVLTHNLESFSITLQEIREKIAKIKIVKNQS